MKNAIQAFTRPIKKQGVESSLMIPQTYQEEVRAYVHPTVLRLIAVLFAHANIDGLEFLWHLLRLSTVIQLAMFPGCDVAKIEIRSIWSLCTEPEYSWPWSYATTEKYFRILSAIGVFLKPSKKKRDEKQIYYFPLRPYEMPHDAYQKLEQLAQTKSKKNSKQIYRKVANTALTFRVQLQALASRAFQDIPLPLPQIEGTTRVKRRQTPPSHIIVDSPSTTIALHEALQGICHVLERTQGIKLLPTTLVELQTILGESLLHQKVVDSLETENLPGKRQQLSRTKQAKRQESTTLTANLPYTNDAVDSCQVSSTDISNISNYNKFITDITDISGVTVQESTAGKRRVDSSVKRKGLVSNGLTEKAYVLGEYRSPEQDQEIEQEARELSMRFDHDPLKGFHFYKKKLEEDPIALRSAVIDTFIRSEVPDPGRGIRRATLGGRWLKGRYDVYHAETEPPPPEVLAWGQTPYSWQQIETILQHDRAQQDELLPENLPRRRPFPDDVVVDSWHLLSPEDRFKDSVLEAMGYLYVDIDGDLLSLDDYRLLCCHTQIAFQLDLPESSEREEALQKLVEQVAQIRNAHTPSMIRDYVLKLQETLDDLVGPLYWVEACPLTQKNLYAIKVVPEDKRKYMKSFSFDLLPFEHPEQVDEFLCSVQETVQKYVLSHAAAGKECEYEPVGWPTEESARWWEQTFANVLPPYFSPAVRSVEGEGRFVIAIQHQCFADDTVMIGSEKQASGILQVIMEEQARSEMEVGWAEKAIAQWWVNCIVNELPEPYPVRVVAWRDRFVIALGDGDELTNADLLLASNRVAKRFLYELVRWRGAQKA